MGLLIGAFLFVLTWLLPITFMILMAGTATSSTRALATRAIARCGRRPAGVVGAGRPLRAALWSAALAVLVVAPMGFVVATHGWRPGAFDWWQAVAALGGLPLVVVLFALGAGGSRAPRTRTSRAVPRASAVVRRSA